MSSSNHNVQNVSELKPVRHSKGALSMHPYFGKVDPALARALIDQLSMPTDTVLDPFCGSGTVLHEAVLLERSARGWDSSPLAVLLATAKLIGINSEEMDKLNQLRCSLEPYGSKAGLFKLALPDDREFPSMPRVKDISYWFSATALEELGFLKAYLNKVLPSFPDGAKVLALTAFSRIITAASNQQGESSYRRVEKDDYTGRVIDLFREALAQVIAAATRFERLMWQLCERKRQSLQLQTHSNHISWQDTIAVVSNQDARQPFEILPGPEAKPADLIVTSPPYLMSWDYGLYHKMRFYWLGYDLDGYEETEIGRHLRRRKDDVERYQADMTSVFGTLSKALTEKSTIAMINAPSVVHGQTVDTNSILQDCAAAAGWKLDELHQSIDIPGPHHGMYASLETRGTSTAGRSGKREHVLIFRRKHC